jgi:hypothetical protein
VNSHVDKLFGKRKRVGYFVAMGVVMWRDNWREISVKGNDSGRWSSDGMVLWRRRMQNEDAVEWWGERLRLR